MVKIKVNLKDNSYYIFLQHDIFDDIVKFHRKCYANCKAIIITDDIVKKYYLKKLTDKFSVKNIAVDTYSVLSGEKSKSFKTLEVLAEKIIRKGINRNDIIYAFGGGVVGDLAGFLSSIILRGVRFVQIPTTLLSQVDSSVGGKTAINSKLGKNLIGTFFQPSAVFIDPNTLNSLPRKELLSGYAEVVKYSLINDKFFFNWLNKNINDNLSLVPKNIIKIIATCVKKKAEIVKLDEKEKKTRMLLNLGHTFAHALENELNYRIRHGEAVSVGLLIAMKLSYNLGYATKKDFNLLENHLKRSKLPTNLKDLSNKKKWIGLNILKKMGKDKKSYKGNVRFILCKGIGAAFIKQNINKTIIKKTIEEFII